MSTAGENATHPSRRRSRTVRVSLVVGVIALGLVLSWGPFRGFVDARARVAEKEQQVQQLARHNKALQKEIDSLSDDATIEALARTKLGYARPGEQVLIIRKVSPPETPAFRRQAEPGPLESLVTSLRSLF